MKSQWSQEEIRELVGGTLMEASAETIVGVASVEEARAGDLVFAESPRYLEKALRSRATAVLTSPTARGESVATKPLVLVENPRLAFVQVLEAFSPRPEYPAGVHPTAVMGEGAQLGDGVHIGALVTVGVGVTLGERVILSPGVRVGDGCTIGADTILHPNVVLYSKVKIGQRCVLHAGCVIGADGFGYVPVGASLRKVPQLGTVEIGDDVEIGVNTCVDRAKTGVTVIGSGSKLDNLVQVAHNVRLGYSCILVAQVGLAGGATLGNGVVMGGQSGAKEHITLGDGARVAARGGAISDVPAGQTVSGFPARPHTEKLREMAATAALPEYLKRIQALERRLEELERKSE